MIDVSKIHSVVLHRKALWQLVTSEEFKASVTEHVNRNSSIRSEDLVILYLSCVKYTVFLPMSVFIIAVFFLGLPFLISIFTDKPVSQHK